MKPLTSTMSFLRSTMRNSPSASMMPMSPVLKKPSSVIDLAVSSGRCQYPLITCGPQVPHALKAAEVAAAEEDWGIEVIDLRTLVPFDDATVGASVRKTSRAVVLAECEVGRRWLADEDADDVDLT